MACALALSGPLAAHALELRVAPQTLDERVAAGDPPHWLSFDPAAGPQPLLVWLTGTGGMPYPGPQPFFQTAREQGYRVVSMSFHSTPAVSQVCVGQLLRRDPDCAAQFRQQRVFGDAPTAPIADQEQDAIVPRLTRLLQHLAHSEPEGDWAQYLDGDGLRWSRIVLAGQSQGGGMAAYLAQQREVGGVLMFSGGWDHGAPDGQLASWYRRPSRTPAARWHSVHHADEPQADALARIDELLGVPAAQRHTLRDAAARKAHTDGIGNVANRALWIEMLQAVKSPGCSPRPERVARRGHRTPADNLPHEDHAPNPDPGVRLPGLRRAQR